MNTADCIKLTGGECYVTDNSHDAFRVTRGTVFVYIVPIVNGAAGRRTLIYEANPGEVIPSFSFTDMDYCSWGFCFVAAEEAELTVMENMATNPLRQKFAQKAGVPNLAQEGFDNGLVDLYRMNLVREDSYIMRTDMEKQSTLEETDRLIASALESDADALSNDPLYDAAAVLCKSEGIDIAPYEKVKEYSGKHITVEAICRASRFSCRKVSLASDWYKKDNGALLIFTGKDSTPAACIPSGFSRYRLSIPGEKSRLVTKETAKTIGKTAYIFYPSFGDEKITPKKFTEFCIGGLKKADIILLLTVIFLTSLICLVLPEFSLRIFDYYIPLGQKSNLIGAGIAASAFVAVNVIFLAARNICGLKIRHHIKTRVQNGIYDRIFRLRESFLRRFDSADMTGRVVYAGEIAGCYADIGAAVMIFSAMLLCSLCQLLSFSVSLFAAALIMAVIYAATALLVARGKIKLRERLAEIQGKNSSVMYQFLCGITKIRIAGIEDRAVYEYMKPFIKEKEISQKITRTENIFAVVSQCLAWVFMLLLCGIAFNSASISGGIFIGAAAAFGVCSAAIKGVTDSVAHWLAMKTFYQRLKPVLEEKLENAGEKQLPLILDGSINVEHVSFSYDENEASVFDNLSLRIKSGEYLGIVGSSGCGKTTLLKLLLGFEQPDSGRIYYGNQDMAAIDLQELRKQFGVVLQDGKLISGSIYENIIINNPDASAEDLNRAIEAAGLKSDIEAMPMGLHTILSEDSPMISGGQQQRILIARALINNPKILFFDEATSALDNLSQAKVNESLENLDCTRIVVAHRLSSVMKCHRIIVLGKGGIIEQGDYQQLMSARGEFYKLANRQKI